MLLPLLPRDTMGRFEDLFCLPLRGPSIQKPLRNGRERVLVVLRWAIRFEQRLWRVTDCDGLRWYLVNLTVTER